MNANHMIEMGQDFFGNVFDNINTNVVLRTIQNEASKPLNWVIAGCGVGVAVAGYMTASMYLLRRKYRHIPGPSPKK